MVLENKPKIERVANFNFKKYVPVILRIQSQEIRHAVIQRLIT